MQAIVYRGWRGSIRTIRKARSAPPRRPRTVEIRVTAARAGSVGDKGIAARRNSRNPA